MYAMHSLDEVNRLLNAERTGTLNEHLLLRNAAALAVAHLGAPPPLLTMPTSQLRDALETVVMHAALHAHFQQHPTAEPSLAEVVLALAVQDGSAVAEHPELVAIAADVVAATQPGADADDVLTWVEAHLFGAA
jgi:hypothetical protein